MKKIVKCLLTASAMCLLILDTKTVLLGASSGIELCIKSILPALFPFCILSKLINSQLVGKQIPFLRPIGKLCNIPAGAEAILLLGFIGGYPFGAQCISDAYRSKALTKQDAQRMLGFCNNAGPAFLFGIIGPILQNKGSLIGILCIQVISALAVGIILPRHKTRNAHNIVTQNKSLQTALEESIHTMALVCGWVIIFRIVIAFMELWLSAYQSTAVPLIITGILELSNGCIALSKLDQAGAIYLLSSVFLSLGGSCVTMQTAAVTKCIGKSYYLPGKFMQTCLVALLSYITQPVFFNLNDRISITAGILLIPVVIFLLITYILHKKG